MKKILLVITIVIMLMPIRISAQKTQEKIFQLGFITPFGTNGYLSGYTINDISINIIGGHSYGNRIFEIGGLYNINTDFTSGLQFAGLFNWTGTVDNALQIAGITNIATDGFAFGQISGFANVVEGAGFQLGGGVFNFAEDAVGVQLGGGLANLSGDIAGLQLGGGLVNLAYAVVGVQLGGGVFNLAEDVAGVQLGGGFYNIAYAVVGVQLGGGLFNITGDVAGVQIGGGLVNLAGYVSGAQIGGGVFNIAYAVDGAQIGGGLANLAGVVVGVQIGGLLNFTDEIEGVQIGLVNYADEIEGVQIGLINIVKNGGKQEFELSFSETITTAISYKLGTDLLYTIYSAGIKYIPTSSVDYALGLGIGTHIDWINDWGNQIELLSYAVTEEGSYLRNSLSTVHQLKLTVSKEFAKYFKVYAGPVLNLSVSQYKNLQTGEVGSSFAPWSQWNTTIGNNHLNLWLGFSLGMRF